MSSSELLEEVLTAKLKHLLVMENNMLSLLPKIKKGDTAAKAQYEWYLAAAKQTGIKELAALGKTLMAQEEVSESFDGFDDG
ncbi:MAG: hypothetical protein II896_04235 [Clostridia bacterium]|nr:hypothetical protein [Clostridia bacterium]